MPGDLAIGVGLTPRVRVQPPRCGQTRTGPFAARRIVVEAIPRIVPSLGWPPSARRIRACRRQSGRSAGLAQFLVTRTAQAPRVRSSCLPAHKPPDPESGKEERTRHQDGARHAPLADGLYHEELEPGEVAAEKDAHEGDEQAEEDHALAL
jgi:hypothetical protein